MSADLLGLDDFYKQSEPVNNGPHKDYGNHESFSSGEASYWNHGIQLKDSGRQCVLDADEADDEFGEFETAVQQERKDQPLSSAINSRDSALKVSNGLKSPYSQSHQVTPGWRSMRTEKQRDESVLFDAEDELEDDFGDFENAKSQDTSVTKSNGPRDNTQHHVQSLIDFDDKAPVIQTASQNGSIVAQSTVLTSSPVQIRGSEEQWSSNSKAQVWESRVESAWEDFQEISPRPKAKKNPTSNIRGTAKSPIITQTADLHASITAIVTSLHPLMPTSMGPNDGGPPSNIPPPALILPAFTPIFHLVREWLHEPLAKFDADSRNATIAHPDAKVFVISIIRIATVLGHIIGGRKLRWKRDTRLAQSMRIGPASLSGKSGGMKLTGVDKAESSREDREVADVLKTWRLHVGKLRSIVTTAGSKETIPELAETLVVRTAQSSEGAITSLRPCALCGMKRNERVVKVDFDIQDSFEEWWMEHWGHKECMTFWKTYEKDLRSR